jgi:predicted dehydrogenase
LRLPTRGSAWVPHRSTRRQVIVIGAGEVTARYYLPALALLRWRATIVDTDHARARSLAAEHRAIVSAAPGLAAVSIAPDDLVVVATPPRTHADCILEAIAAGAKRILVEKPPVVTVQELRQIRAAADEAGALVHGSFIRRSWYPMAAARRHFASWSRALGALEGVAISDGRPWKWASVGARQRGSSGLEPMTLDELAHPLDAVFFLTGWNRISVLSSREDRFTLTPWSMSASLAVEPHGDPRVDLTVNLSRTDVLANALTFRFARGSVVVESSSTGGVRVLPAHGSGTLLEGPLLEERIQETFARVLSAAAGLQGASDSIVQVRNWIGPLTLIEAFLRRRATGRPRQAS